jgi:hypothetical protein
MTVSLHRSIWNYLFTDLYLHSHLTRSAPGPKGASSIKFGSARAPEIIPWTQVSIGALTVFFLKSAVALGIVCLVSFAVVLGVAAVASGLGLRLN